MIAIGCGLLGVDLGDDKYFSRETLSPMAASFYEDNKRVVNTRIKQELGVKLRYPDYQAGLLALYDQLMAKNTANGDAD